MNYIQIQFEGTNEAQNEILIALLSDLGFEGFEENIGILKACIKEEEYSDNLFDNNIYINSIKYSKSLIKKQNWNKEWEEGFQPIAVNYPNSDKPFVYLKAGFHENNDLYKFNIEVTPKMSFGTGHHATTYLMVEQMAEIKFKNKTVLDFGTGTGVLAILAEKLGASDILAIDCDEWSIENTQENIVANQCSKIRVQQAETIPTGNKADIILANINLNIITDNLTQILDACNDQTIILFSGIMLHDESNIVNSLTSVGLKIKHIFKKDNWLAILTNV